MTRIIRSILVIISFTNKGGNYGKIVVVLLLLIGIIELVANILVGVYAFMLSQEMNGVIYILSGIGYLSLYFGFASDIENIKMTF